jgi:hypothetical protein
MRSSLEKREEGLKDCACLALRARSSALWPPKDHLKKPVSLGSSNARSASNPQTFKQIRQLNLNLMQKRFFFSALLAAIASLSFAQLKSPGDFLPHQLGQAFTPHHQLVDYFKHVAANSSSVQLMQYGMTYQDRPLMLAFVSTPENLAKLEDIRKNNLRRAGMIDGSPDPALDRAIVWLSFSVHGNEAAGSESSMAVIYELADPGNRQTQEWLKNTIVIMDPSLNPDGYSRYTSWYRNVANRIPDPNGDTREHREPWPGGRVNHYLFDLNRDWAWQTQIESRHRAKIYGQWLPHVHPDLHEQYPDEFYYFAPAARPYHQYITKWQADFQETIGRNHARYFDANGWLYFTRESFDLFYPSYGDTYPTFHGSIGMTYEQAGHSKAGRALIIQNGDTLTLAERIEHHKTTALSTVEVSSRNATQLVRNFEDYFKNSMANPPGEHKTFIIKGGNAQGRLKAFCELLDRSNIRYGKAGKNAGVKAYDYQTGQETTVKVEAGDLLISAYQPLAIFTQVLMEPRAELEDSLTYDITAWSLPYAYGLEAYASTERLEVKEGYDFVSPSNVRNALQQPFAYLVRWNSLQNARFLAAIFKKGIKARFASAQFRVEGRSYEPGTLVITRGDNRKNADFDRIVRSVADELGQEIIAVATGFTEEGNDLGSSAMRFIQAPRIAMLSGKGVFSNSFGQAWHFFEQDLGYPVSIFEVEDLPNLDLNHYNLLILNEGSYRLDESALKKLGSWVSNGGRLIAIGWAVSSLEDKDGFGITQYVDEAEREKAKKDREAAELNNRLEAYGGQDRRWVSNSIPGAIFKVKLDQSHPLSFGMGDHYFSLKTGAQHYDLQKNMWNVGTLGEELMISGFAGAGAKKHMKNTVIFAVEEKGGGSVVYMIDNPLYRGFWENGKFLFSNAVFFR